MTTSVGKATRTIYAITKGFGPDFARRVTAHFAPHEDLQLMALPYDATALEILRDAHRQGVAMADAQWAQIRKGKKP